ncbi:MAG: DUF2029 domain-containing protein [Promethearchaeota archaeon]|nr:MAG: DUF2029 domain-containing protein [Candidatus Lokiarchaeota archaeon]
MNIFKTGISYFKSAWKFKIFRYAIYLQIFYFILSAVLTLIFFRSFNDFNVYYEVGQVVVTNITELYQIEYQWPFRYFPLSAFFFVPFYYLGFDVGFIVFNILNLMLNGCISILLFKIIMLSKGAGHEKSNKRAVLYISLYLMGTPQLFNLILGQINLYVIFLILLSLYLFLSHDTLKWRFIASVILGISAIFKPVTLFLFPFLIILRYNKESKKIEFKFLESFIRIVGALIPLALNLILFIFFPPLLEGFININLTGEETVLINHSMSITKLISNLLYLFGISGPDLLMIQFPLFICVLSFFALLGFIFYFILQTRRLNQESLIYGYILGILIMFLSYFDTWNHHLLIINPLLIIIIFNFSRTSLITDKIVKKGFSFLNFFDIIFTGIFFITESFFPLNFAGTIFLIMILYGIFKFCYRGDSQGESDNIP